MGQYHIIVNLDKQEVIDPWEIGWGAKQKEHTGYAGSAGDAIYLLTQTSPNAGGGDFDLYEGISGRWAGDRVVVLGDYTEDSVLESLGLVTTSHTGSVEKHGWSYIRENYTDISHITKSALDDAFAWETEYQTKLYEDATLWRAEVNKKENA
jgi:hypothetical protein